MQFDFILPLAQSLLAKGRQPWTRILQLHEHKNTINALKMNEMSFTIVIHSVTETLKPFSMQKVMQPYQKELHTGSDFFTALQLQHV